MDDCKQSESRNELSRALDFYRCFPATSTTTTEKSSRIELEIIERSKLPLRNFQNEQSCLPRSKSFSRSKSEEAERFQLCRIIGSLGSESSAAPSQSTARTSTFGSQGTQGSKGPGSKGPSRVGTDRWDPLKAPEGCCPWTRVNGTLVVVRTWHLPLTSWAAISCLCPGYRIAQLDTTGQHHQIHSTALFGTTTPQFQPENISASSVTQKSAARKW